MSTSQIEITRGSAALGLALDPQQIDALGRFLTLLQRWNAIYNLTSIRDPEQMLTHHVLDCLAIVPALNRRLQGVTNPRLLDVGSGAGLPGVVLAIACPRLSVTCVDAVGKKTAFIRQAAAELGLANLQAAHARVEKLVAAPFAVITSRAFATLADFVRATRHLLESEGSWLAMKGKDPSHETAELPVDLTFHVEHLVVPGLVAERCLVWVEPRR